MRQRRGLAADLHGPFKYNFFSSIKKLREYGSAATPLGHVARRNVEAD